MLAVIGQLNCNFLLKNLPIVHLITNFAIPKVNQFIS